MARTKKHTTLYEYLHQAGVLETTDDELIKKVKAAYWRKYHRDYKQEKRKKDKEYSISLSKTERAYLEKEAIKHGKSISMFLKEAAWAYIHSEYLNPDKAEVLKVQQILSRCYSDIERLSDSRTDPIEIQKALDVVMRIEEDINRLFEQPVSLEGRIRQTLDNKPYYMQTIKSIIESYDNQIQRQEVKDGN